MAFEYQFYQEWKVKKKKRNKIFYKLRFATVLQNFQIKNGLMYILGFATEGLNL